MQKKDCGNIEDCIKIFVSWQWSVITIIGFVVVLVLTAWAGSARFTKIEYRLDQAEKALVVIYQINTKIDSLLKK